MLPLDDIEQGQQIALALGEVLDGLDLPAGVGGHLEEYLQHVRHIVLVVIHTPDVVQQDAPLRGAIEGLRW